MPEKLKSIELKIERSTKLLKNLKKELEKKIMEYDSIEKSEHSNKQEKLKNLSNQISDDLTKIKELSNYLILFSPLDKIELRYVSDKKKIYKHLYFLINFLFTDDSIFNKFDYCPDIDTREKYDRIKSRIKENTIEYYSSVSEVRSRSIARKIINDQDELDKLSHQIITDADIEIFKTITEKCSVELMDLIIKKNNNVINIENLNYLIAISVIISLKMMIGEYLTKNFELDMIKIISKLLKISKTKLIELEFHILDITNFQGCFNTRLEHGTTVLSFKEHDKLSKLAKTSILEKIADRDWVGIEEWLDYSEDDKRSESTRRDIVEKQCKKHNI